MSEYKVIDRSGWPRAEHYNAIMRLAQTNLSISFEVDITRYLKYVREKGCSFTLATVYLMNSCANAIENFRYRILDGEVILYDCCDPLFTYLDDTGELYKLVFVPMTGDMDSFIKAAAEKNRSQKVHFEGSPGKGIIRYSAIPWISFTHIASAYTAKPDYATPIISWGKYSEKDGRVMMPVNVQAHHGFVDGLHIGRFAELLQKKLDEF